MLLLLLILQDVPLLEQPPISGSELLLFWLISLHNFRLLLSCSALEDGALLAWSFVAVCVINVHGLSILEQHKVVVCKFRKFTGVALLQTMMAVVSLAISLAFRFHCPDTVSI